MSGNERIAKILGYAGLIPFVVFSTASWLDLPFVSDARQILLAYAAIILSFMGAVHWGVAMTHGDEQRSKYFIASVMPALAAWPALFVAEKLAFVILILGFILLIGYDWYVKKAQGLPDWYIPMRNILTVVVVICLTVALMSVNLN